MNVSSNLELTLTNHEDGSYTLTGTNNTQSDEVVEILLNESVVCTFEILHKVPREVITWQETNGHMTPYYDESNESFNIKMQIIKDGTENVTERLDTNPGISVTIKDGDTVVVNNQYLEVEGSGDSAYEKIGSTEATAVVSYIATNHLTQSQIEAMTVKVDWADLTIFEQFTETTTINYVS